MTQTQKLNIVDGPGKFELMLSLFEFKPINFTVQSKENKGSINGRELLIARIIILKAKESTRKEWFIEGLLGDCREGCEGFEAYYNLWKNQGWLKILDRQEVKKRFPN